MYKKVLLILSPTTIKYKPAEKSAIKNQKNFMKRRIAILTVALVAATCSLRVSAQAGSLDPTWGKNGPAHPQRQARMRRSYQCLPRTGGR